MFHLHEYNSLQAAQFLILVLVTPYIDIRLLGYEFEKSCQKATEKVAFGLPCFAQTLFLMIYLLCICVNCF